MIELTVACKMYKKSEVKGFVGDMSVDGRIILKLFS
jgi:hypothetical protein